MYEYTTIDGQRVEKNVAAAFIKWAAAFKNETGVDLHVRSGTRTQAEQQKGRDDYLAGRTSVVWADPSESSHCEIGPSGPRALDLYDSGSDAGVTVKGSPRWNVAVRLGQDYGFTWGGWGVPASEGWHFENHKVQVGVYGVVKTAIAKVAGALKRYPRNLQGIRWIGVQRMLKSDFQYRGAIDNMPGAGSIAAFQRFVNAKGYAHRAIGRELVVDGRDGKNTLMGAQQWLKERWGYTGSIDAKRGSGTDAAWARAEAANDRAFARIK